MDERSVEIKLKLGRDECIDLLNGDKWQSVAWDLDQWLRNQLKYTECTPQEEHCYRELRTQLNTEMESRGLFFSGC